MGRMVAHLLCQYYLNSYNSLIDFTYILQVVTEVPRLCMVTPVRTEGGYSEPARLHKCGAPVTTYNSLQHENIWLLTRWPYTILLVSHIVFNKIKWEIKIQL